MIFIAIGGNLPRAKGGTVEETFAKAANLLEDSDVSVRATSNLYRSPAWPPSDQPDYLNAVWRVETAMSPQALLTCLHDVERELGRDRSAGVANAARTIDLDLIDYAGHVQGSPPILPHPRMHDRAFVLLPLADIAGAWQHPVSRRALDELIAALPSDHGCFRVHDEGG